MFDMNMKETLTGEVKIMDLEVETLKQLLEFIYTGEVYSHYEILKCSMMNRFQFFKPTY